MNKNKYLVFISIGFELIALILVSIYLGTYLVEKGWSDYIKVILILVAFVVWFTSLILKLKAINNSKKTLEKND